MAYLDSDRLTETFDILSHPHRRYILYYLTTETEVVGIDALANAIAKWDGDCAKTGDNTVNKVEAALLHTHLPKLATAGIITYGPDRNTVELGKTRGVSRFLDEAEPIDGYTATVADD